MSDSYGTGTPGDTGFGDTSVGNADTQGKVDTAKQEASDLKATATEQAKDVVGTAKDEASSVLGEAKSQAKDLYAQSQRELKDQAHSQQQRIADGLRSVSDELGSMASNSDQNGLASDLVRQVSGRLSGAASWLGDRDPNSVLTEVTRYARRKPATFIFAALVAGVVVGRLTRALASNASDEKADADGSPAALTAGPKPDAWAPPAVVEPVTVAPVEDTPIYSQASPAWTEGSVREDGDVRSDTL